MIKVYFDDTLISDDSYVALSNDYKLFTDNFYLGSTASNTFKLSVAKSAVSSHPAEVKITDDTNTYYLIVDKIYEEKNFYVYDLVDKLVLFNFNYNAKTLIDARAAEELTTTLSDILADMCTQAGVTLDSTLTLINDIEVTWYDNTLLARDYLSYIAELQGGYARILDDGKLTIVGHKMTSQATLQIDNCEDFILGEKKTISRVVYDNGIVKYEYGDETANTLYINPNNVYITDTTVVSNIYDEVVGLEFYLVETGRCQLDPSVRAGDIITFTDGTNSYLTIAGYSASFGGGHWLGNYSLNVASKQQEETQIIGTDSKIKSIKTIIDRTNASLAIVATETNTISTELTETTNAVSQVQTDILNINEDLSVASDNATLALEGVGTLEDTTSGLLSTTSDLTTRLEYQETTVSDLVLDIDGVKQSMTYSGGYNLIENCVKQFGEAGWTGTFVNYSNTEIQQNSLTKSALVFMNDTETREIQTENRVHNFSFKYKKLVPLATTTITINGIEIELTEDEWTEVEQNIVVESNLVTIEYSSDADNSVWLVDPLLIPGNIQQIWTPNPNEINTGVIKLGGDTLTIESTSSSTVFKASTDGTRVYNVNDLDNPIAEFTSEGVETNKITGTKGEIGKVLILDLGTQTWFTRT